MRKGGKMKGLWVCLFCVCCAVSCAVSARAQVVELEPIRVLAAGWDEDEAETEAASGFGSPESLAGRSSGVDIQSRMGFGFLQDVSIRGAVFEDADVSLNGISLNNPQTGHFNLSLPGVSSDVTDVDVDLNGQALDFQLAEPLREGWCVRTSAGSRGTVKNLVSVTQKAGLGVHRFSLEGLRTDGLRDETDGHRTAGSYLFRRRGPEDDVTVYAAVSEKRFGENGAYAAPWYMREEEFLKQEFVTASWKRYGDLEVTLKPYLHRTQDLFWLDRDNPSFYRNDHTTWVSGNVLDVLDPDNGRFVTLEVQRQDLRSTNLGDHNRFVYTVDLGVRPQDSGSLRSQSFGVKTTHFDNFPLKIMPFFDFRHPLSDAWGVEVEGKRIFRQPSFTELYYNSPSNIGNADLNLQRSDNLELGLNYRKDRVSFRADVFYRRQKDTIDWVCNTGDAAYRAVNAGRVNVRGFDLTAGLDWEMPVFDRLELSYTRLDVNRTKVYDISKYVFDYLRDRAAAALSGRRGKLEYALKGTCEYHIDQRDRWLLGAEASYHLNDSARIFATGENLLDEDYDEFLNVQGDPFFVELGLELRF